MRSDYANIPYVKKKQIRKWLEHGQKRHGGVENNVRSKCKFNKLNWQFTLLSIINTFTTRLHTKSVWATNAALRYIVQSVKFAELFTCVKKLEFGPRCSSLSLSGQNITESRSKQSENRIS